MSNCTKCGMEITDMTEVCPGCMASVLNALTSLVNCPDYRNINTHEMTKAKEVVTKQNEPD